MLLYQLGEFGLIKRIQKKLAVDSSVLKGSGDDCAVIAYTKTQNMLLTCDMLVEGVDFRRSDNPALVGRKALAVSLSDIAACSGLPRYALVSLGARKDTPVAYIDKLLGGMRSLAREYAVNIVGGDLSRSPRTIIDVALVGVVAKNKLTLRSAARKGDIIFVTGTLGSARCGKHFAFTPRLKVARRLAGKVAVHAMIDVSDGLAQDLGHILSASGKGAVIYESLLPKDRKCRSLNDVLYYGEEFELVFTVSASDAKKIISDRELSVHPIGEIVDAARGLTLVDKQLRERKIQPKGFRHF